MPRTRIAERSPFFPCDALLRLLQRYRHAVRAYPLIVEIDPLEEVLLFLYFPPELFYVQATSRPISVNLVPHGQGGGIRTSLPKQERYQVALRPN